MAKAKIDPRPAQRKWDERLEKRRKKQAKLKAKLKAKKLAEGEKTKK